MGFSQNSHNVLSYTPLASPYSTGHSGSEAHNDVELNHACIGACSAPAFQSHEVIGIVVDYGPDWPHPVGLREGEKLNAFKMAGSPQRCLGECV